MKRRSRDGGMGKMGKGAVRGAEGGLAGNLDEGYLDTDRKAPVGFTLVDRAPGKGWAWVSILVLRGIVDTSGHPVCLIWYISLMGIISCWEFGVKGIFYEWMSE